MNLKSKNRFWFTLIELVIWMTISAVFMFLIIDFVVEYQENSRDIIKKNDEYSNVNLWLKSLQKLIFEKWKYFTINPEALQWWNCENYISTDPTNTYDCSSKFWFIALDENGYETEYFVDLKSCNIGNQRWKQLVYWVWQSIIPLFWECIYSSSGKEIEHIITFPNSEIKEKILRYTIRSDSWKYTQTFYVR